MEETIELINPFGFIYITTNKINGKKYIGQRKFKHNWQDYLGSGTLLKYAIKKYGKEYFIKYIIAIAYSKKELDELEIMFIKEHDATNSDDYYNIASGGNVPMAGLHHSNKTKEKMRKSAKGELRKGKNNPNYGKPKSDETLRKLSESKKGHIVSEETRQKISRAQKGKHLSEETKQKIGKASKGKKHSEETKKKLSLSHKGRNNPNYGKHLSEEAKQKLSLSHMGDKNSFYGKHHSDEIKQKISELKVKLTNQQVTEIREKYATGEYTQQQLAEGYNVSHSVISDVINFKKGYKK